MRENSSTSSHHSLARSHSPARGARFDQVAVGLAEGVDVAHTAGRRRGHRLLEQHHALLVVPGIHLRAAEQAEREDLEIVGAVRARDVHRPARMGDLLLGAGAVTSPLDRHPPVADAAADAVERALRAGQPAAGRRSAARHEVLVRDPDGHARRVVAAAGADVGLERALAHGDAARDIAQEPQRLPQAVAGVGRLAGREHGREGEASGLPVRSLQRLRALDQRLAGGQGVHEGPVSRPTALCSSGGLTPSYPPPRGTPSRTGPGRRCRGSTRRRTRRSPRRTPPRVRRGPRWPSRRSRARSTP